MSSLINNPHILDRMVNAVEAVKQRLLRVVSSLSAAGVPYAIVGGHAVAAWVATVDAGAVRNTQDVDVLVRRADFAACKEALERAGFVYRKVAGLDIFLDGPSGSPRSGVHLVFADEMVRAGEALPNPPVDAAESMGPPPAMRVISLRALVQIKLTAFRDKDRVHLRDLIEVGLVDESWLSSLPPVLSQRLKELLDDPLG